MNALTRTEQARVDRAMTGEYIPHPTDAEKAEIERRWFAAGRTNRDLGRIQGWTRKVEPKMWKAPKVETDDTPGFGLMPGKWAREAACAGDQWIDAWHPGDNATNAVQMTAYALAVCKTCPVRRSCLDFALEAGPSGAHGIWGATTAEERKKFWRARGAAA
jgi:WhiB family redox-sensing transcriptional regulator